MLFHGTLSLHPYPTSRGGIGHRKPLPGEPSPLIKC